MTTVEHSDQDSSRSSNVTAVAGSAIVAALAGFFLTVVSARGLNLADNAAFLVFWSAFSAITAVLSGIQNETTRAVRRAFIAGTETQERSERRTRLFLLIGMISLAGALLVLALIPAWNAIFGPPVNLFAAVCGLVIVAAAYPVHLATVGSLAGLNSWNLFALLSAAEPTVRLILALIVGFAGTELVGFYFGVTLATLTWVLFGVFPLVRKAWRVDVPLGWRELASRMLQAMAATAFSAVLINGFPILMSLTTDPVVYSSAAPLVTAVSVTRAPLLMPLVAFQSMIITAFVDHPERAGAAMGKLAAAIGMIAVAGGIAAYFLGPWLMRFIYGANYEVGGVTLGLLVLAAACLALLMLGGAIALALDLHRWNMAGWAIAVVIAVLCMLGPWSLPVRTILGLVAGPLCGSAVHYTAIYRTLAVRARVA